MELSLSSLLLVYFSGSQHGVRKILGIRGIHIRENNDVNGGNCKNSLTLDGLTLIFTTNSEI